MSREQLFFLYPMLAGVLITIGALKLDQTRFAVRGVVGPYFTALVLLFGLFASLTAGDVWQRVGRANTLVATAVNSLRSLLRLAEAVGPQAAADAGTVRQYATEVERQEFAHSAAEAPNATTFESLRVLYRIAVDPAACSADPQAQAQFLASLESVRSARFGRLALRKSQLDPGKLKILFLFGLLTQIAIALCHAGNTRALGTTVMLFSIAFSICVSVFAMVYDPAAFAQLVSDGVLMDLQ